MSSPPRLADRHALALHRKRAMANGPDAFFLFEHTQRLLEERLEEVNRTFTAPAVVSGLPDLWSTWWPTARMAADEAILHLEQGAHDLVAHLFALHWADDPVGQMIQCRRALAPDGMFVAAAFGGRTLSTFRECLRDAEVQLTGGLAPRVAPMSDLRDLGSLLQRAGFALPVADSVIVPVSYASVFDLMHDLRGMGETNALANRLRVCPSKRLFTLAEALYHERHAGSDGRITAEFEIIFLTGWAPHESQQKPLRPGSAEARLSDALDTEEHRTGDKTPRRGD